jgi:hypothetical protein
VNAGRIFVGTALAAVGTVFLLDGADVLDASEAIARWWPVLLMLLGVLGALDRGRFTNGSWSLIGAGALLLAVTTGLLGDRSWALVWPAALIAVGGWLAFGWGRRSLQQVPDVATLDGLAVLSSTRVATRSRRFRHASLTAVLGGVTLDLTDALPDATGATVDATAVLGSITVLVPRGWLVDVRGVPLLGGWDDTTDRSSVGSGAPRVEVRALVALGGLEVKHAGRWTG